MNDDIVIALVRLKESIDKQNELQEEANGIMRGLVGTLQQSGQATADLVEALSNRTDVNALLAPPGQ